MTNPPSESLTKLQDRLGYTFRNSGLLECAVTHPSRLQDQPTAESNQRLEFLGDAVLQLVLTEALYGLFPAEREGILSRHRAALANGPFLAQLAREIGLDACLRLGGSEESSGGRLRDAAAEDAFEALIGAIHLDSDYSAARNAVLRIYGDLNVRLAAVGDADNPKGRLQEIIQAQHGNDAIRYELLRTEGVDHARSYEVAVFLRDRRLGTGRGSSKKLAEEAAAREALAALKSGG